METSRLTIPALEEILGQTFAVLDDGFVRVVDYMGGDAAVVQAARVSYGEGTQKVSEDRGLIRYLMRHRHTTPLEMAEIKLHVRMPLEEARQWLRHRTASINEVSGRYSVMTDKMAKTASTAWRLQSTHNKQGSDGFVDIVTGTELSRKEAELQRLAREVYEHRLEVGVAREQARKDQPLSTYTEFYWKVDLHNLLHFLALRMDGHAQQEIRAYATTIGNDIVSRWTPLVWEAFNDYHPLRGAGILTRLDSLVLNALIAEDWSRAFRLAGEFGWLEYRDDGSLKPNRERAEFQAKAKSLGVTVIWPTYHELQ